MIWFFVISPKQRIGSVEKTPRRENWGRQREIVFVKISSCEYIFVKNTASNSYSYNIVVDIYVVSSKFNSTRMRRYYIIVILPNDISRVTLSQKIYYILILWMIRII